MNLRQKLQDNGLAHKSTPNPTKVVCNNCDSTVTFDLTKAPQALILTLTDSLTGEVFYCPNCGPNRADSYEGVSVE